MQNPEVFHVDDGLLITNIAPNNDKILIGHFAICIGNDLFLFMYGTTGILGISTLEELLGFYQKVLKKDLIAGKLKPGEWNPNAYFNISNVDVTPS